MALTVCLLTRNDESRLGRALPSVAGIADELLVADAGSTDRTIEVARAFGARVLSVSWEDDFGQARNQALAEARGDWLLWLNPDEEFDRSTTAALHACVQEPEASPFAAGCIPSFTRRSRRSRVSAARACKAPRSAFAASPIYRLPARTSFAGRPDSWSKSCAIVPGSYRS
jgi:glycosyltransferase involved in cell wall biosynthesis